MYQKTIDRDDNIGQNKPKKETIMTITEFNHLAGYVLVVLFFFCIPEIDHRIHNLFVVTFYMFLLIWASTGIFVLIG